MEERIFGTECEYALYHQRLSLPGDEAKGPGKAPGKPFSEDLQEMSQLLVQALGAQNRPLAGEFLENGGRFYIDRGSHPEYATPECRSACDTVAHEKAGDRLVRNLISGARGLMAKNRIPGSLHAFKNNQDPRGNTYGSHENYLVSNRAMVDIHKIIPFLLTRQIFTGAGKISSRALCAISSGQGFPFSLSQRADFIDRVLSDRASDERGIINTRKREITRSGENMRLHVILGDSNMSEYALKLKIGVTGLVLRMLEDGLEAVPAFSKPVEALKCISQNPSSTHELEGQSCACSALDIQTIYLEKALQYFATRSATAEEKDILALWERTVAGLLNLRISCRGVIEDDPGELRRKLDWVIKLWLLNRAMEKAPALAWSDPQIRCLDFRYHDLDPETGLFERCAALELVDRVIDEKSIVLAMEEPPPNTRACMRSRIIREASGRNVDIIIEDWESIKIFGKGKVPGMHPFDRQRLMVKGLKASLKDPFESCNAALLAKVGRFMDECDAT